MSTAPEPPPRPPRAAAQVLIVLSVSLQAIATTRLLCPPRSLPALAPLRIACPPLLWPFIDYPMFSEPHEPGDSLAWVEVKLEVPGRTPSSHGLYEVRRSRPDEPWESAFEREEDRLRAELGPHLVATRPSARLAFERHRRVLTERGLVPPAQDVGGPAPDVRGPAPDVRGPAKG